MIKFIVSMIGIFWLAIVGAGSMYWWDRRPHDVPSFHVAFLNVSPPDSIKAQLDAANSKLEDDEVSIGNLSRALQAQNAGIEELGQASSIALDKSENDISAARSPMVVALANQMKISVTDHGGAMCDRVKSVDAAFLETLK